MLKVLDDGVQIVLVGKSKNPLWVMSIWLVVVAVAVAVVAMTMPVDITIGVMFIFALLIFTFNHYKDKLSSYAYISTGELIIKSHHFITNGHSVKLSATVNIDILGGTLQIKDRGRVWHISGFGDEKELSVAKSVLEGRLLQTRERAIKLA